MSALAIASSTTLSTSAADAAPLPRALYLLPAQRIRVDANGHALVVTQTNKPARYYPMSRISRIVCNKLADWTGVALMLCMDRRVTLSWVNQGTELIGYCLPHVAHHEAFHICMEKFAAIPAAAVRWDNWFRHRRMRVLHSWAEKRAAAVSPVSESAFCEMKRRFVYLAEYELHLDIALVGPFQSAIIERLNREGALCTYPARDDTTLSLLDSLTLLLWGEINLEAGAIAVATSERRLQWMFLETWLKEHADALEEHLIALKQYLAHALISCH